MTVVDLDVLDKLRSAATPGPWAATSARADGAAYIDRMLATDHGRQVAHASIAADAALIVGAVNALPDLIAEARKYRALREAVEGLADILVDLRAVVATVDPPT